MTIPNSVKEIEYDAFANCENLESVNLGKIEKLSFGAFANCENLVKITILDNCTKLGNNIFANHNEDLTIYCYEGSRIAEYAIENNIKYVYITRPAEGQTNEPTNNEIKTNTTINTKTNTTIADKTTAKGSIPQTGVNITIVIGIVAVVLIAVIVFVRYRGYKEVK